MAGRYDWVTTEIFEQKLEDLVTETYTITELLAVPGVRDVLREQLNNEVLEQLEYDRACNEDESSSSR